MRSARWFAVVVVAVSALGAAACGDSSDDEPEADATTTPAPAGADTSTTAPAEPATTTSAAASGEPAGGGFGETDLVAPFDAASFADPVDVDAFGVDPADLEAAWYTDGDRWAVHYRGLEPEGATGKCLGSGLGTDDDARHEATTPYGALACQGHPITPLPPGSLHLCEGAGILFTTEIPVDAEGELTATIEQLAGDGSSRSVGSTVTADDSKAVPIEVSLDGCQVIS